MNLETSIVIVTTKYHPVLKEGDICRVRLIHDTHYEVVRGEDERHTSIAKDLVRIK